MGFGFRRHPKPAKVLVGIQGSVATIEHVDQYARSCGGERSQDPKESNPPSWQTYLFESNAKRKHFANMLKGRYGKAVTMMVLRS